MTTTQQSVTVAFLLCSLGCGALGTAYESEIRQVQEQSTFAENVHSPKAAEGKPAKPGVLKPDVVNPVLPQSAVVKPVAVGAEPAVEPGVESNPAEAAAPVVAPVAAEPGVEPSVADTHPDVAEPAIAEENVAGTNAGGGNKVSPKATGEAELKVMAPTLTADCRKIGEKIQLDVAPPDSVVSNVTWLFHADNPNCPWITVASEDMPGNAATMSATWDTNCVRDYPNDCGYGHGVLRVETMDQQGESKFGSVSFCLESTW